MQLARDLVGLARPQARRASIREHHVGDHQCAGDGIARARTSDMRTRGSALITRFDLLRIDLETADIDDAAAAAAKIVAACLQLDQIAGVDVAVAARECWRRAAQIARGDALRADLAACRPRLSSRCRRAARR